LKEFDIGFLGGGQLARMSIMAAQRMGLRCLSLDASVDTPASQVASARQGSLSDEDAVAEVFRLCERVTLENEFVLGSVIEGARLWAGAERQCLPDPFCLERIQDKLVQRRCLAAAGVPSPPAEPYRAGDTGVLDRFGFPLVVKSRYGGYDGKGTKTLSDGHDVARFDSWLSDSGFGDPKLDKGWLVESFVPFERELAVMVYRSPQEEGCFPVMVTEQEDHVCSLVWPREGDQAAPQAVALAAVRSVGGFGLFGVELFELSDGSVQVNEIAPRPHNTGHYTLDWGGVSQFEQHVRLVMELQCVPPVGQPVAMANLLGTEGAGDWRQGLQAAIEADPEVRVHWYGKAESRPGRKMGHLNVPGPSCRERAVTARERFYSAWRA
jgi:5-(carboxyamino)imidazole ribonucleotide synthase